MSQEVRDAVARLEGWTKGVGDVWQRTHTRIWRHPIPNSLDACAKAWDDHAGKHGYFWFCTHWQYVAWARDAGEETVERSGHDAASELRDRWRLLWEVLKARGVV